MTSLPRRLQVLLILLLSGAFTALPARVAEAQDFDDFDDFEEDPEAEEEGEPDPEAIWLDYKDAAEMLDTDSEIALWEEFIREYPDNPRVEDARARLRELEEELYELDEQMDIDDAPPTVQAKDAEIPLVRAQNFYSVNPRTTAAVRLRVGIDGYFGYELEFEYGILRQLSVFGNFHNRRRAAQGLPFSFEAGGKYALFKSKNRGMVLSAGASFRVGFDTGLGARAGAMPFIAFGWIPGEGEKAQVQAFFGVDLPFTPTTNPAFNAALMGSFRFHRSVGLAVETSVRARPRAHDGVYGTFPGKRSNTFVFAEGSVGLLIFPWKDKKTKADRMELRFGASVPYVVSYWRDYNPLAVDIGLTVYFPKKTK